MREKEIQEWVELAIESRMMNYSGDAQFPFHGDGRFTFYALHSNFPPNRTNKPWILERETLLKTLLHAGSKRLLGENQIEQILGLPYCEIMRREQNNELPEETFRDPLCKDERAEVERRVIEWCQAYRSKK